MKTALSILFILFYFNVKSQTLITSKENFLSDEFPKAFYRDGKTIQWIINSGISITTTVAVENLYGKYYSFYISVENLSGEPVDFNPENIAIYVENNIKSKVETLNSDTYLKKVKKKQKLEVGLNSFVESLAASAAAYSSTTSTSRSTTNLYGSSSQYYITHKQAISSQTYDGQAAYIAQQNAKRITNEKATENYEIRKNLMTVYLKRHTIFNEERLNGAIKTPYFPGKFVHIVIPINGIDYSFKWERSAVYISPL